MGKEVWYTFLHILKNTEQKKPKSLDDLEELKFYFPKLLISMTLFSEYKRMGL